jgi:hypothetical protein
MNTMAPTLPSQAARVSRPAGYQAGCGSRSPDTGTSPVKGVPARRGLDCRGEPPNAHRDRIEVTRGGTA